MKKEKIIEYFVVSLFAIGAAIFEKYTTDKDIEERVNSAVEAKLGSEEEE